MSNFISLILLPGLIEMPPESNVTALPTKPSTGPDASGRVVAQRDQLRLLVGALGDAGERAHARRLDLRAAHHLERERVVAVGDLARALGERASA